MSESAKKSKLVITNEYVNKLIAYFNKFIPFIKHEYFYKPVLCIVIFVACYYIIFNLFNPVIIYSGLINTQIESARSLISTIVTSEIAVLAIVITLSLVAVQLASSSYSVRLMEVFNKSPEFWILTVSYLLAISYGLIILKMLNEINDKTHISNLEWHICFACYTSIFIFFALIPYIIQVLNLTKPFNIIEKIKNKITAKNILNFVEKRGKIEKEYIENDFNFLKSYEIYDTKPVIRTGKDPIQPIVDIIQVSLIKYDFETFKNGLEAIKSRINLILDDEKINDDDKEEILKLVLTHLTRIGNQSVKNEDEEALHELMQLIDFFRDKIVTEEYIDASILVVDCFGKIGRNAVKKELEYPASFSAFCLGIIGKNDFKDDENQNISRLSLYNLISIGRDAFKREFEDTTSSVVISIAQISKAIKKEFENIRIKSIDFLGEMGISSTKAKFENTSHLTVINLGDIGEIALKEGDRDSSDKIIIFILEIGKNAIIQKLKYTSFSAQNRLKNLGKIAIEQELKTETIKIAKSLAEIAIIDLKQNLEVVYSTPTNYLRDLGIFAVKKSKDNESSLVIGIMTTLRSIGEASAEMKIKYTDTVVDYIIEINESLNEFNEDYHALFIILKIAEKSIEYEMKSTVTKVITYITKVIENGISDNYLSNHEVFISPVSNIGEMALKKQYKDIALLILEYFTKLVETVEKRQDMSHDAMFLAVFIVKIGKEAYNQEFYDIVLKVSEICRDIAKIILNQIHQEITLNKDVNSYYYGSGYVVVQFIGDMGVKFSKEKNNLALDLKNDLNDILDLVKEYRFTDLEFVITNYINEIENEDISDFNPNKT